MRLVFVLERDEMFHDNDDPIQYRDIATDKIVHIPLEQYMELGEPRQIVFTLEGVNA